MGHRDGGRVQAWMGTFGTGKTLSLSVYAYKNRRRYDEVVSNYSLNLGAKGPPVRVIESAQELLEVFIHALATREQGKRRLIVLDEIQTIFDARFWKDVPRDFLKVLAQPRKALLDIFYTTQHESMVEKRIRDVTQFVWWCDAWGKDFNPISDTPFIFWATCYAPWDLARARSNPKFVRHRGKRFFVFRKKWGALYDTMEVMDVMDVTSIGGQMPSPLEVA